ncbi:MAG: primosomal protein N' [Holosporaceae bacterium]|jgi:primosomal protein N' (replication factor Y)|nr:primosomal protein N' [Holosporaceae bacterium]
MCFYVDFGMAIFSVLPVGPFDISFSYYSNEELHVGDVVEVSFGRRNIIGLITDDPVVTDIELKDISIVFGYNIGKVNYDFLQWVSDYTMIPRGNVLKMMLAEKVVFDTQNKKKISSQVCDFSNFEEIKLSEAQLVARQKIAENAEKPFLLQGVTGSGKTEIYLSVVMDILLQQKQALLLFPEIALTQQILKRIEKYFKFVPIVWNSSISPKNKKNVWEKAISGEPCIVVGARSALFVPFKNLGIIVVDEEHDPSYKQENGGFYNARDMAVVRGHLEKIPVILSSATPSLESYVNAQDEKYGYAFVGSRFGASQMPSINLIDMRQRRSNGFISQTLLNEIKSTLSRGEQCLIYLNRRGYSPVVLCKSCGEKVACPNCSAWLVYHRDIEKLICHYCSHKIDIPKICVCCSKEDSYVPFGPGIERIFEELRTKLPEARIEVASSDTLSSNKNIAELFEKITNNEVDIIVGTQILAKGHHFPNITLVGIVDGDLGLSGADLRASEKTYQLISQVAGRAGRAEKRGEIFIQTFSPDHPLYKALRSTDPNDFMKLEIETRRSNELPPFSKFASIIVSGTNKQLTEKVAKSLGETSPRSVKVLGPAPAPFFLLCGRTRWRFLLKTLKKKSLNTAIKRWIFSQKIPKNIKIQIDIDPTTFL